MKTMMTFAAVALCGLTVLVAGCKDESKPADQKDAAKAAETAKDTAAGAVKGAADAVKGAAAAAKDAVKK